MFLAEGGVCSPGREVLPAVTTVTPSGISYVDYVDSGTMWGVNSFTYSFPTSPSYYTGFNGGSYGSGEQNTGFQAFNSVQQAATATCGSAVLHLTTVRLGPKEYDVGL